MPMPESSSEIHLLRGHTEPAVRSAQASARHAGKRIASTSEWQPDCGDCGVAMKSPSRLRRKFRLDSN
jgi:hypothetical protein